MLFPFIELGEIFASIGVRELQPNASEAFAIFSEAHRYANQQIYGWNNYILDCTCMSLRSSQISELKSKEFLLLTYHVKKPLIVFIYLAVWNIYFVLYM